MNPRVHRSLPGTHVVWLGAIALALAVLGPEWGTEPRALSGLIFRSPEVLTLPAGTLVAVRFGKPLSSHENQPGEVFRVRVERDVTASGLRVVPRGATVVGSVVAAGTDQAGGQGRQLGLDFHLLELPSGERVPLVGTLSPRGAGYEARDGAGDVSRGEEVLVPADAVRLLELVEEAEVPVHVQRLPVRGGRGSR